MDLPSAGLSASLARFASCWSGVGVGAGDAFLEVGGEGVLLGVEVDGTLVAGVAPSEVAAAALALAAVPAAAAYVAMAALASKLLRLLLALTGVVAVAPVVAVVKVLPVSELGR